MTVPVTPKLPEQADLSINSIKTFLKLVESHKLIVRVQATTAFQEPTYYLSTGNGHTAGDLKKPGKLVECVFITATNLLDFGVTAAWYDGVLVSAFVGGEKSGHRPEKLFTQITKLTGEIKRCLA